MIRYDNCMIIVKESVEPLNALKSWPKVRLIIEKKIHMFRLMFLKLNQKVPKLNILRLNLSF